MANSPVFQLGLESFAFLYIGRTSVNCQPLRKIENQCLTNPLNLQLSFLRLEAVVVGVKKGSPETHDSQINSHLKRKLASML